MALEVWLSMNGNLNNQGLSDVTVTNNGATVDNNGKIGKCYSFDGNDDYLTFTSSNFIQSTSEWSVTAWVNLTSGKSYYPLFHFGVYTPNTSGISGISLHGSYCNRVEGGDGTHKLDKTIVNAVFQYETWMHISLTYDNYQLKYYLNGNLIDTIDWTYGFGTQSIVSFGSFWGSKFSGKMNDFRIYDHALSPREVAEIAKGLVLHYPLNDWNNASNLVYNGFGENGSDGWTPIVTVETTDLPSADTTIKASFTRGVTTDYIPINPNNTYAVSCYLKALSGATGYTYPSIEPYDIDKKFIWSHNCAVGFNNTWKTTLSQPLNTGDTVIHATDISNWSTANNNYYYHVSIFGYRDSTGRLYPDMEYTQDSPVFGTYSDKSNLNKTNNTITLNAPYTGAPRPAGTVICQSTEGSTYFYPFAGVQVSTIADWTQKSATVNFGNESRLCYARYIKWQNYSGAKYAGIKITDTTWGSNVVYDTSGFGNNGTAVGEFELASESPRYSGCTYIKNTSNITHPRCLDNTDQEWTCCAWVKLDATTQGQPMNNFNSSNNIVHVTTPLLYLNSGANDYYMYGSEAVPAETWTHIAFVFKNSTALRNVYINGVLKNGYGPNKTSTPSGIPDTVILFNNPFSGYVSDYREYATALTADQVKQLYEAPISLSNNGTLMANEFNEI